MVATAPPLKFTVPAFFWTTLSSDDRAEFVRLRSLFSQMQKTASQDRRGVAFSNELLTILGYIERSPENLEARSVVTGVCFVGPLICVNTRQLMTFVCRCKSSINGILQELGYVPIRTRLKTRRCIVAVLPSLDRNPELIRQWTVRHASNDTPFCFVSRLSRSQLPPITRADLQADKPIIENTDPPVPLLFRVESLLSQPVNHRRNTGLSTVSFRDPGNDMAG
jgi:hypothetical protein